MDYTVVNGFRLLFQLKMSRMFSSSAELTEIAESANGLFVSNIIQKAGISVTEMGTVAYAATGKYKTVTSLLRPIIWDGWKRIYFRAVIIRWKYFQVKV